MMWHVPLAEHIALVHLYYGCWFNCCLFCYGRSEYSSLCHCLPTQWPVTGHLLH